MPKTERSKRPRALSSDLGNVRWRTLTFARLAVRGPLAPGYGHAGNELSTIGTLMESQTASAIQLISLNDLFCGEQSRNRAWNILI